MEWEKPQLVDLNMVKYGGACSPVGGFYDGNFQCMPTGAAAEGACSVGSSALNQVK